LISPLGMWSTEPEISEFKRKKAMRLVILGGPGAGKGTQAQWLCLYLRVPLIPTGDLLRKAIASTTDSPSQSDTLTNLGHQARQYVEKGELVPDTLMIEFMRQRLVQPDVSQGWLLEGFPRTAFQAEELDFQLEDLEQRLDWAIYLQVPESVLRERSLGRSRFDDQPDIIQHRIALFQERTLPILEYYSHRQRLLTINGNQSPEQVQQEILQKLKG
jgi:adenylate kinase